MATITASAAGGNTNTNGAWVGGVQPTAADDVLLTATSGNLTIPSGVSFNFRSLDCTGYVGNFTFAATTSVMNAGDASGGAVKFVSTMTLTLTGIGTINFVATTASTTYSLTTGGKVMPNITVNAGSTTTIQLADALTATGAVITLTAGKFDTNGQSVTSLTFILNGATARTITFGSSSITLTGTVNATFGCSTVTNLTVTANTATVTIGGTTGGFNVGSINLNGLSVVLSGSGFQQVGTGIVGFTVANFTRTGTASLNSGLTVNNSFTVTGTLTLNSNSSVNRLAVISSTVGTTRTITAGSLVCTNVIDFADIAGAGAATWTTAASGATYFGDCGGTSGITMTPSVQQTATGTASFTWSTHGWTTRVPLPQDDVVINNAFVAGQTITADMPRLGRSISFTGGSGNPTLALGTGGAAKLFFGSLTLVSGMTTSGTNILVLSGQSSYAVTSAGVSLTCPVTCGAGPGTYTLQDAFNTSVSLSGALRVTTGTFNDNGYTITLSGASSSFVITAGTLTSTGNWTIGATAAATFWSVTGGSITQSGTITLSAASTNTRTFVGGGKTYGTLTYTVASSPGGLTITGANTFGTVSLGPSRTITWPSSTTNTVTTFNANGVSNGYVYLPGVGNSYISTPDSAALSITSDITLMVRVAPDHWVPSVAAGLLSKYGSGGATSSYMLYLPITGKPTFYHGDGTTTVSITATVAPTIADGSPLWVLASWRMSDGRVQFFTADGTIANPAASDFTQLGTNLTLRAGVAMVDSALPVEIGSYNGGGNTLPGKFYRAKIYNGVFSTAAFGGSLVMDADLVGKAFGVNSFAESSTNAATMTINGAPAQAGDGRVQIVSSTPGTAAALATTGGATMTYVSAQDIAATPSGAVYALDSANVSGNTGIVFAPPDNLPFRPKAFSPNDSLVRAGRW